MYLKAKLLKMLTLSSLLILSVLSMSAWADAQPWQVNMTPGINENGETITQLGKDIFDLHMLIFEICVWIGIGVFGFMFYSLIAYRKSKGHEPATFHHNTAAELAWTIIPTIILIAMAVPASKTLIEIYNTDEPDLDVLVTGYQWYWSYEYVGQEGAPVKYFSKLRTSPDEFNNIGADAANDPKGEHYLLEVDNALVLPVNKKTRLLVTANDVIHAWWVPELAVKKDAIPGFVNEAWTKPLVTGVYRGQCAELCGKDHGFMPIVVNVVEQEEFDAWFAEKQKVAEEEAKLKDLTLTMDEALALGEQTYSANCASCHGVDGKGTGVAPAIAGSAVATGELANHMSTVINGVPGTMMPAFGNKMTPDKLAAVITYQRNAFGNNMGDLVQPIDVYNTITGGGK